MLNTQGSYSHGVARIQLVRAPGFMSGAIAYWGGAGGVDRFSHFDIVLPDGYLLGARDETIKTDVEGYEVIPPGVQIRPPGYAKWVARQVVKFYGDTKQIDDAYEWALEMVGHKYDEDAILGIIFGQRWHKNGSFICSAFGTDFMRRCGWLKAVFQPSQRISPNTAYAMAGAGGGILVREM